MFLEHRGLKLIESVVLLDVVPANSLAPHLPVLWSTRSCWLKKSGSIGFKLEFIHVCSNVIDMWTSRIQPSAVSCDGWLHTRRLCIAAGLQGNFVSVMRNNFDDRMHGNSAMQGYLSADSPKLWLHNLLSRCRLRLGRLYPVG
jgi:hypothetical protein